jgi:hypothetical protein
VPVGAIRGSFAEQRIRGSVTDRPVGWYLDPENPHAHRYWDGEQWRPVDEPAGPGSMGGDNGGG